MIEEEFVNQFIEDRQSLREEAKRKIEEIQIENCRTYNKKRKSSLKYQVGDLVAIKRTQFAPCSKLLPKFLGPYRVTNRTGIDRYEVEKIGNHEGPKNTTSSADQMKPFGANDGEDGRDVGWKGIATRTRAAQARTSELHTS
jgi:hypothetical protein